MPVGVTSGSGVPRLPTGVAPARPTRATRAQNSVARPITMSAGAPGSSHHLGNRLRSLIRLGPPDAHRYPKCLLDRQTHAGNRVAEGRNVNTSLEAAVCAARGQQGNVLHAVRTP